jgi:hypothetical protein
MEFAPPRQMPLETQLIDMADKAIPETAGLSGFELNQQQDLRRVSGTVVQSVKESSTTMTAILFDSLRAYRKEAAESSLRFMQEFYEPEDVKRIVGPEKAEQLPESEDMWPDITKFDLKIDEAASSINEKMEFFDLATRTGTADNLLEKGIIPPDMFSEWIPFLDEADQKRVKEYQESQRKNSEVQGQLDAVTMFLESSTEGRELMKQYQILLKTGNLPVDREKKVSNETEN